ncbi:unnamed protein product [Schistosoma margrebowiei]|uniref:Uncharacterized protein n=1 Tax=Schistosoma margrebowiei TaxID=48269 RepID=A0A183LJ66_9TREM|nr:unnamed protein product [Schistosoma margrebowiei]
MSSINQNHQSIDLNQLQTDIDLHEKQILQNSKLSINNNIHSNHYLNKSDHISITNKRFNCNNTTMSVLQSILHAGSIDSIPVSSNHSKISVNQLKLLFDESNFRLSQSW